MSGRGLGILAVIAAAVVLIIVISSGSDNGSSGWSSDEVAEVESALADEMTANGLLPSKEITGCFVKGIEPLASASEVLEDADATPEQEEEIANIASSCTSNPSDALDDLYGGEACSDNLSSGDCIEEVQEKLHEYGESAPEYESSYPEEDESTYGDEYETDNEGLDELNEELQQEYEE